jgi:hypothetical protein
VGNWSAERGIMKNTAKKENKKAKYEKPVLKKFQKLTDLIAGGSPFR